MKNELLIPKKVFSFELNGETYYYVDRTEVTRVKLTKNDKGNSIYRAEVTCPRCAGAGQSGWRRSNGICYLCHGLGYSEKNLKVTKNKQTAENRLKHDIELAELRQEENRRKLFERNLEETKRLYSDIFYLILDTLNKSTYEEREYLKSLGARWNNDFRAWYIASDKVILDKLDGFKVVDIPTKNFINKYNRLEWGPLYTLVCKWKEKLDKERGV